MGSTPALVVALGPYDFKRALAEDEDAFVLVDEYSLEALSPALEAGKSVIVLCGSHEPQWYEDVLLGPARAQGYYTASVMRFDSETTKPQAESFMALCREVDAFGLFSESRCVWSREGQNTERISDAEVVEALRAKAEVEWMEYLSASRAEVSTKDGLFADLGSLTPLCIEAMR